MISEGIASRYFRRNPHSRENVPSDETDQRFSNVLLKILAEASVIHGDRAHGRVDLIQSFLTPELRSRRIPASRSARERRRLLVRRVYGRIKAGDLNLPPRGCWNGAFFSGLRLSHALRLRTGRTWEIYEPTHRELLGDLEAMPLPHRLEAKAGRNRIRRLRRCPATFLPSSDGSPADQLAGLFAGSSIRKIAGQSWLELPGTDQVKALLDDWAIPFCFSRSCFGRERIVISPFYAALVAHHMPHRSAERILRIKKPALCPLLPAVYWDLVFSQPYRRYPPFSGCLPFACSRSTYCRNGIRRKQLHRSAVVEQGIMRVDAKLRGLMSEWSNRVSAERQKDVPGERLALEGSATTQIP